MDVYKLFKSFEFTESDANVYMALVKNGPCSRYEVSKLSGVPRSKVYNVCEKLLQRGLLSVSEGKNANLYKAVPIEKVTSVLRKTVSDKLDALQSEISRMKTTRQDYEIWQLQGYEIISTACVNLVRNAQKTLFIQIWAEELNAELERAILERQPYLEQLLVILYDVSGCYKTTIPNVYRHGFEEDKLRESGCRWTTVSIDGEEVLHATIHGLDSARAICTKNSLMVFFANEYVLHDAYCLRIIQQDGRNLASIFGGDLEGVRQVFQETHSSDEI